jgi:ABC-type uncharacterized transport system substrate-binding protein
VAELRKPVLSEILLWIKQLGKRQRQRTEGGGTRELESGPLRVCIIGLEANEFDHKVHSALTAHLSSYHGTISTKVMLGSTDEQALKHQIISFLYSFPLEPFDLIFTIGYLPSKALAAIYQEKDRQRYPGIFLGVRDAIKHGIIDDPLTAQSVITGMAELPVDYATFIQAINILGAAPLRSVLMLHTFYCAQYHRYEIIEMQEALKASSIGVKKLEVMPLESFTSTACAYISTVDAVIVPRDKMMSQYAQLLGRLAHGARKPLYVAEVETGAYGASFSFGMSGQNCGTQGADFAQSIVERKGPIHGLPMQLQADQTVLRIYKGALDVHGACLDIDKFDQFDLCPIKILQ